MSKQWYGSINNRLEENRQFCEEITVGTGVTEYLWSDSHAYEVVEVTDQKHVAIRQYDVKNNAGFGGNDWELTSNENNPVINLAKRGKYWYKVVTATADLLDADVDTRLWLAHNGFDANVLREKGKQTKYHRMNISFGVAREYYDWSF